SIGNIVAVAATTTLIVAPDVAKSQKVAYLVRRCSAFVVFGLQSVVLFLFRTKSRIRDHHSIREPVPRGVFKSANQIGLRKLCVAEVIGEVAYPDIEIVFRGPIAQ